MSGQALGLVETFGYIGAIEAADVCLKAANVKLIGVELVTGGLVTVGITGDVGAVKAAIDASKSAVEKVGRLISTHVIPRPAVDTSKLLCGSSKKADEVKKEKTVNKSEEDVNQDKTLTQIEVKHEGDGFLMLDFIQQLNSMKVVELRVLARQLEGISMERNHIKFATRKELLEAILDCYERKS